MLLVRDATVYAPEPMGRRDLLCGGGSILAIEAHIDPKTLPGAVNIVDADGAALVPGFIDGHVHVAGGGGEAGFASRTPPLEPGDAFRSGVTTVLGVLGTDGVTRSMEELLVRVYALRESGISAWCLSGSYRVPPRTLTGDLMKDVMLLEPVLGLGELALSDHRSSRPSDAEFARLCSEARVGGMLSGKAGIVCVHLGDAPDGLGILERAVSSGELPRTQLWPTHCGRNPALLESAYKWVRAGGYADFTAAPPDEDSLEHEGQSSAASAFDRARHEGLSLERITWTSDGQGSLPRFDAAGNLVGYGVGTCESLLAAFRTTVIRYGIPLETALLPITRNPATILKLRGKGTIVEGADADLVILGTDLKPNTVIASGRVVH